MSMSDKHLQRRDVRTERDPWVVTSVRIRRSTLERASGVARFRGLKPAVLLRKMIERSVRRAESA